MQLESNSSPAQPRGEWYANPGGTWRKAHLLRTPAEASDPQYTWCGRYVRGVLAKARSIEPRCTHCAGALAVATANLASEES